MTTITWDELQGELARLTKKSPKGFTTTEFADQTGCSVAVARAKIGELIRAKKIKFAGNRSSMRIDGRPCAIPVYCQSK